MLCYTYVTDLVKHADELAMLRSSLDQMQQGIILLDEFPNARYINGAVRNLWELPDDRVDRNPSYVKLLNDLSNTRGIVFRRTKLISTSKIVSRWCVQVTQARWTFPTGMAELSALNARSCLMAAAY